MRVTILGSGTAVPSAERFPAGVLVQAAGETVLVDIGPGTLRRLPRPRQPLFRLALSNLHRPGAPTTAALLSLGLGLTVLVAVALLEHNLERQISQVLPEEAPGYYFIDIQPDQAEGFEALVAGHPGIGTVQRVPMLRVRIIKMNGKAVEDITPPPDFAWVLRGGGITSALIGASRPEQVVDCAGAVRNLDFTEGELDAIDELADEEAINLWARSSETI